MSWIKLSKTLEKSILSLSRYMKQRGERREEREARGERRERESTGTYRIKKRINNCSQKKTNLISKSLRIQSKLSGRSEWERMKNKKNKNGENGVKRV
jgi:hypothetical protein